MAKNNGNQNFTSLGIPTPPLILESFLNKQFFSASLLVFCFIQGRKSGNISSFKRLFFLKVMLKYIINRTHNPSFIYVCG